MVRAFSSCAEQLPSDAEEWDVSGFLIDGKPFERATVSCWLHAAHSLLHGPGELEAGDLQQLSNVHDLLHVLVFARTRSGIG